MIRERENVEIREEFSIRILRRLRQLGLLVLLFAGIGILLFNLSATTDDGLPDCRDELAKLTKLEIKIETCQWIIGEYSKEHFVIFLNVNGHIVAEIEISFINITDAPDFEGSPYLEGWNSSIEVKQQYWNQGLGQLIWKAGDQYIRSQFGRGEVRIYINASANNPTFADVIRKQVSPKFVNPDGDFIYVIR